MFDSGMIAIQAQSLMHSAEERANIRSHAYHFAEIVENDGVGQFFDESDALLLCQNIISLVEALDIRCNKNGK